MPETETIIDQRVTTLRLEHDEGARLAALHRYDVLDTEPEAAFDRIVRLARTVCGTEAALIGFADSERLWFKAKLGISLSEMTCKLAMCNTVVKEAAMLVVPDASLDPRFAESVVVKGDGGIRFYAGAPLVTSDGHAIGTLCVTDTSARPELSPEQQTALLDLAKVVVDELEGRLDRAIKQRAVQHAILRDKLLVAVADAADFRLAVEAGSAILREATGASICLVLRLAPGSGQLHQISCQGATEALTELFRRRLSATNPRLGNSISGAAVATGQQIVVHHVDERLVERYPQLRFSVDNGFMAQIVTPLSIGDERYVFNLGFTEIQPDLNEIAEMVKDVGVTVRPMLRRLHDAEQIELFRRVAEASGDGVIIADWQPEDGSTGQIRYVNAAFTRQTQYAPQEVIGHSPDLLFGPAGEVPWQRALEQAVQQSTPVQTENVLLRRDGSSYWAELTLTPVADASGRHTHWAVVVRDITERKTAQQALALNEQRFRIIAQASSDIVWDWDLLDDSIWRSGGVEKILGQDLTGDPETLTYWRGHIHADDHERVVSGLNALIEGTGTAWREEYRMVRDDGTVVLVSDQGTVLRNAAGKPMRMVGRIVDVGEQRYFEEQLRQNLHLDAVGRLTAGMAHDFSNVLAVIMGNAELLTEMLSGDEQLRSLAEATQNAAERGAELTSRLRAFSSGQSLKPQRTDLNRLLGALDGVVRRVVGVGVAVEYVRGEDLWEVMVDPSHFENALLNLCLNAREAMPNGGHLRIETANVEPGQSTFGDRSRTGTGRQLLLVISDKGGGMTREVAARAFEPYFTTKRVGKGNGLGLSMVFGFVKQSRGRIEMQSEPGQGTQVKIYLPAMPPIRETESA